MRQIFITAFLLACGGAWAGAATLPGWDTNHVAAVDQGRTNGQPVLLYFTASWCGPCKLMARSTLTNEAVAKALGSLIHTVIDIDEYQNFAAEHFVRAVPTFQMLSPDGDTVDSLTGFQEAAGFAQWLTNSARLARESSLRTRELAEKLAQADKLLGQPGAHAREKAAGVLFDLCGERNAAVQAAVSARLKTLAAADPKALLPGLNHARLAARIQAANLLRERMGDTFDVDPWSSPADRAKNLQLWREKLSGPAAEAN